MIELSTFRKGHDFLMAILEEINASTCSRMPGQRPRREKFDVSWLALSDVRNSGFTTVMTTSQCTSMEPQRIFIEQCRKYRMDFRFRQAYWFWENAKNTGRFLGGWVDSERNKNSAFIQHVMTQTILRATMANGWCVRAPKQRYISRNLWRSFTVWKLLWGRRIAWA